MHQECMVSVSAVSLVYRFIKSGKILMIVRSLMTSMVNAIAMSRYSCLRPMRADPIRMVE